jgi:branched-chain amino acid transport system substrate-binding protein
MRITRFLTLLTVAGALVLAVPAIQAKEIVFGYGGDRSGPVKTQLVPLGDGMHSYFKVFNKKKLLGAGNSIRLFEIDIAYNTPRGVEAYERFKTEGAVLVLMGATPVVVALTPRVHEDKIPLMSPGFGSAKGGNGKVFPYLFPVQASYWSQGAAGIKFILDKWEGKGKPKIAYLYYDNPAGREPLPVVRDLQKRLGLDVREFACPPPCIDMRPQVLDITRRYRADWVLAHVFGSAPTVMLKEFSRVGYDRDRLLGLVWATGENVINVAGWETSDGYQTLELSHIGSSRNNLNHPILKEIAAAYREGGESLPETMDVSVYFNRGVAIASVAGEAIRRAVEKRGNADITGTEVRDAMESIQGYDMDGFMAPVNMTPEDHEGGGFVRVYQVHDGGYRLARDWFQGYREVVMQHLQE